MDMIGMAQIIAHKNHRKYKYLKGWSEWQDRTCDPCVPNAVNVF
jgi:hypothetical protein